jgi:hypothetical protein
MTMGSAASVFLAVSCCVASGTGCRRVQRESGEAKDVRLSWSIAPDPPATGPAEVHLALSHSGTEAPLTGARLRVEGNMSHPGMAPIFATAGEQGPPGRYQASLTFTMAGDWFLLVTGELRDGRHFARQVDVPAVRARR